MKFLILIPARYASSRFPGKPLAKINGKEMILHVVERALQSGCEVAVATDDKRIADCVSEHGYEAVMTSTNHRSGTDRLCEAAQILGTDADVVINLQGDEPFINPDDIRLLMSCFTEYEHTDIATLVRRFPRELGMEGLKDPSKVKVVFDDNHRALYFSRSVIPYVRDASDWLSATDFYLHVGIYAYRLGILKEITSLPPSTLEKAENLEQLRWLQGGYGVRVAITDSTSIGIDTPEDLKKAEALMRDMNKCL